MQAFAMAQYASPTDLSRIIQKVQEAALEPALWQNVCEELAEVLGGASVALHFDAISPIGRSTHLNAVAHGIGEDAFASYEAYYREIDPYTKGVSELATGETAFAPFPKSEVEKSAFYEDWMKPMGLQSTGSFLTVLSKEDSLPKSMLGAYRLPESPEWGDDLIDWMNQLTPHIQHALRVTGRIIDLEARKEQMRDVLDSLNQGLALIDEQGDVLFMNRALTRLSLSSDGLGIENRQLRAQQPAQNRSLQTAIQRAVRGSDETPRIVSSIAISSAQRPYPLMAQVFPLDDHPATDWTSEFPRARAGVWTMDLSTRQPAPFDLITQAFSLTPAEARAAVLLAEGISPNKIADEIGITTNSAREYTKRVMAKTGTHRQPELVRLLRSLIPPGSHGHLR